MPKYLVTPAATGPANTPIVFGAAAGQDDLVLFGRLNEQGPIRSVVMDITTESVIAIFGKRGSGKSYTLGVLAEALAASPGITSVGTSSGRKGALLIDTLNVFWSLANPMTSPEDQLKFPAEATALRSWGITPPAVNVTVWIPQGYRQGHTPASYLDLSIAPADLDPEDLLDLVELDGQSDPMGQLLLEVREKVAERVPRFTFEDMLELLDSDDTLRTFYAESTQRGTRQRIRSLARLPLFASPVGTPLAELIRPGHLSVLEFGEVSSSLRAVMASVLLRRIHAARARASDAEKQLALNTRLAPKEVDRLRAFLDAAIPPCWVLVDEAQNVLPADRQIKSSDAVLRFVREGRNFGLSFALTTQQPSAVDQRILAQADTIICHKLTVAQDMARMRDNLKSAEPGEVKIGGQRFDLAAWLRSLDPGTALVTNTEHDRVFALQVRPRVTPHGGTGFRVGSAA